MFHSLSKEHLGAIVEIQLRRVEKLLQDKGYGLTVTAEARGYLADVGYDPDFGARPLKRAIQRELQDPLALKLLSGEFHEGQTIRVERGKDGLTFSAAAEKAKKVAG